MQVAEECLQKAGDLSGLLLLYTAKGSGEGLGELIKSAGVQNRQNIVFLCHLLLGNLNACVNLLIATNRIPEAAFFARTYVPSRMTEVSAGPQLIVCAGRASLLPCDVDAVHPCLACVVWRALWQINHWCQGCHTADRP